jgi:predicted RNase H-like HicB family nuclease
MQRTALRAAAACWSLGINPQLRDNGSFLGSEAMELTAVLTPAEEGGCVALNPETGTTTQGETVEEAIANLTEATALYLSEFPLPAPGHPTWRASVSLITTPLALPVASESSFALP